MAKPSAFGPGFAPGFGVGRYHYALAPWVWTTGEMGSHWQMPSGAVGGVDLRTLPQQATAGGAPQGFAFVTGMQSPGGVSLGRSLHMSQEPSTTLMRDAWQSGTGFRPAGATMADLLWDQLTTGSDPSGETGPKPLVPETDNVLRLYVGGHSMVKSEKFRWGVHPHTNRVRDLIRRDFEQMWEQTNGGDHCRRVLDHHCVRYKVDDWKEFIPPNLHAHVPGRLPHATTITDSLARADSSTLGTSSEGWSWTEMTGDFAIFNNAYAIITASAFDILSMARADYDLSTSDHYTEVTVYSESDFFQHAGVVCRKDSTATATYYSGRLRWSSSSFTADIYKVVTGTQTNLASVSQTLAANTAYVVRLNVSGSSLDVLRDAVSRTTVTDSAVSSGVRTGIAGQRHNSGGIVRFYTFSASDVAAAAGAARVSLVRSAARVRASNY